MQTYGVIGDPVEHSLSPPMHRAAYEATGLDADYSRFHVNKGNVEEALRGAKALGLDGLNVTIPHKQAVAETDVVENTEKADEIGAVNTVDLNEMRAYNTDASGARRALEHHNVELDGKSVVIVGAGGAARAIAFEFAEHGTEVAVANRTQEKAFGLADEVSEVRDSEVTGHSLDEIDSLIEGADVLVNATSVGMEEDETPVPRDFLHSRLVVFDIVYTPRRTRLLKQAEEVGAKTVEGSWMLVYQGAEAFEIWTREDAPVEVMDDALKRKLR
ncbi:MAG: shikimate dehydrogenase [Halobacteria archaeon]|nr:shikimate dehydrogenase [Halobacteria archaeon]